MFRVDPLDLRQQDDRLLEQAVVIVWKTHRKIRISARNTWNVVEIL